MTADHLCSRLESEQVELVRVNSDEILEDGQIEFQVGEGASLVWKGSHISASAIRHLWYRRPKPLIPPGPDAEARQYVLEWSAAFEGFLNHIPIERWINHPARNALASQKMEQLTRARQFGLRLPRSVVTQDAAILRQFWESCEGKVVTKPLASGMLETDDGDCSGLIYTATVSEGDLENPELLAACPTLFQQQVEKSSDIRVTFLDGHVVAVALHSQDRNGNQIVDIRQDNWRGVLYEEVGVPLDVLREITRLMGSYGLRFAAMDFVVDRDGEWYFLEINPNGQWAWLDIQGTTDIASRFVEVMRKGNFCAQSEMNTRQ